MLSEQIEEEIRTGHHDICLDLENIKYISSAGIRVLVKYYKQLKSVSGQLFISHISDEARSVLEMVGLDELLKDKIIIDPIERRDEQTYSRNGISYNRSAVSKEGKLKGHFYGKPRKIHSSDFLQDELRKEKFAVNKYGLGLGAFGHDFEDCSNRFGEFIGIGDSISYLPSDGSNTPDYTMKTGKLIPEICMLYGIVFEGMFSDLFNFKTEEDTESIKFSNLIDNIGSFTKFENAAYVLIAETSGLIGASFIKPPTELNKGYSPFRFPELRDYLSFTTEPEYRNMLTVTIGVSMKEPPERFRCMLRPLSEKLNIWGHFHTAVFYFHPIGKKEIDLNETVLSLFENEKILNIMHLINDERLISGIGESEFVQGKCWVGPLDVELKAEK